MAIQNYPKKWAFKPPLGTQLNFGHPLAKGMVGCWMFNEVGGFVQNLVSGVQSAVANFASPNWGPSLLGTVWKSTGNTVQNNYSQLMNPVPFPMSIVGIFALTNIANANGATLMGHADATANVAGYWLDFTPASPTVMRWNNVQVVNNAFSTLSIPATNNGVFYFAAVTVDKNAGTATGYLAPLGTPLATQTVAPGTIAAGTLSTTFLFDSPLWNPLVPGQCSEILFYNRVLTPGEINWLNADPYAFMMPKTRRQNKQATVLASGVEMLHPISQPTTHWLPDIVTV